MFRLMPALPGKERRSRRQSVRALVDALNRRDYQALRDCLASDCLVTQTGGGRLKGPGTVVSLVAQIIVRFPEVNAVIETLDFDRGTILARGHFDRGPEWLAERSLWRFMFEGDRISRIEMTQANAFADTHPALEALERAPNNPLT